MQAPMPETFAAMSSTVSPLSDRFGRAVTYLRLSVTDRCDLRCTYCMSEDMRFLPRSEVLTLEELHRLVCTFIDLGIRKVRITGGEPLVRKGVMSLFESLKPLLDSKALDEVTLTTNGSLLAHFAADLARFGVRRVNVSLDSLSPARFRKVTRTGNLDKVLEGIDAAQAAGLKVKLNAVAMRGAFEREVDDLINFAHGRGMDLTLIEEMPLGHGFDRSATYLPLSQLRSTLAERWTLAPLADNTGGPARYVRIAETRGRLGFITPMSCNFCQSCNRVRVSCSGRLFTCMGDEGSVSLRDALRRGDDGGVLTQQIREAIMVKPEGHNFAHSASPDATLGRMMSVLGG